MDARPPDTLDFEELADALEARLREEPSAAWSVGEFDRWAQSIFRLQFEGIEAYRALCERRDVRPETLRSWEDAPAVPATAFKHLDLSCARGGPEAVFLTSGTTAGRERRGRHAVPRLSLYTASLLPPFRAHVLAGAGRMRFASLVPPASAAPDSSLSYMVGAAARSLATSAHWLVDAEGRLDLADLRAVARRSASAGEPLLLLGTALSLVRAVEALGGEPLAPLADGSRIMHTGGFKGAERSVTPEGLRDTLSAATGVPAERIVGEYGMTELLSQLYEPTLTEGAGAAGDYLPPPWLRVRALDPRTLDPVSDGEEGLLAFFDLANVGSVAHVLTEDVGSVTGGRVRLRGRVPGAEPRGCSRALDELMTAAGRP